MTQIKSTDQDGWIRVFNPGHPWLRFGELSDLFEGALVLFEFLARLAEFSLRRQSLVILKLLN